jgi:hypothetical protein
MLLPLKKSSWRHAKLVSPNFRRQNRSEKPFLRRCGAAHRDYLTRLAHALGTGQK